MQKVIQRVFQRLLLASVGVSVGVQRQTGDGLCQDSDTGINSGRLQGCTFIDGLAAGGAPEKETIGAARQRVCRLVTSLE